MRTRETTQWLVCSCYTPLPTHTPHHPLQVPEDETHQHASCFEMHLTPVISWGNVSENKTGRNCGLELFKTISGSFRFLSLFSANCRECFVDFERDQTKTLPLNQEFLHVNGAGGFEKSRSISFLSNGIKLSNRIDIYWS